jgi:hypothetical protein
MAGGKACHRGGPLQQVASLWCSLALRLSKPRSFHQAARETSRRETRPQNQVIYSKMFDWLVAAINNAIGEDKVRGCGPLNPTAPPRLPCIPPSGLACSWTTLST